MTNLKVPTVFFFNDTNKSSSIDTNNKDTPYRMQINHLNKCIHVSDEIKTQPWSFGTCGVPRILNLNFDESAQNLIRLC